MTLIDHDGAGDLLAGVIARSLSGLDVGARLGGELGGLAAEQALLLIGDVYKRQDLNIPPFGGQMDFLTYGGICRAVCLDVKETAYQMCIRDRPWCALCCRC